MDGHPTFFCHLSPQLFLKSCHNIPSVKLTCLPLKMDGWKTILSFWDGLFSGAMLVLGRVHYPQFTTTIEQTHRNCARWLLGEFEPSLQSAISLTMQVSLDTNPNNPLLRANQLTLATNVASTLIFFHRSFHYCNYTP